jgi:hypothetical protein
LHIYVFLKGYIFHLGGSRQELGDEVTCFGAVCQNITHIVRVMWTSVQINDKVNKQTDYNTTHIIQLQNPTLGDP